MHELAWITIFGSRVRRNFLTLHCDVTTVDLWRQTNVGYLHCDVIFVYCSCTRKLAQRRSSHVNNNCEFRFLATRYSRLRVLKKSLSSSKPAHSRLSLCVKLTLFCNSTKYVLMTVQWPILIIMYAITLSNTKKKHLSKRFLSTAGQILWRDDKNIKFVKLVLV